MSVVNKILGKNKKLKYDGDNCPQCGERNENYINWGRCDNCGYDIEYDKKVNKR
jgi:hypothetical protein